MPFPGGGRGQGRHLGGDNQVISTHSENLAGALKWIDYITGEENQKRQFLTASQSPTLKAIYDDPDVQKKYDFATQLRDAISQANARPVSPVYPQICTGDLQERQRGARRAHVAGGGAEDAQSEM